MEGKINIGDLVYFSKDADSLPHHAAMVSSVFRDEIYYTAHTESRYNAPLSKHIGDETVYIIRLMDDCE